MELDDEFLSQDRGAGIPRRFRAKFKRETLREMKEEMRKHVNNYHAARDNPELVEYAAEWYAYNIDPRRLKKYRSNGSRPTYYINKSIEKAFIYYVPQILLRLNDYISRRDILEELMAEKRSSGFLLRGILQSCMGGLSDTDFFVEPKVPIPYEYSHSADAIAGELINKRNAIIRYSSKEEGEFERELDEEACLEISNVLDKYRNMFDVSFPKEVEIEKRLTEVVANYDNYHAGFWEAWDRAKEHNEIPDRQE